MATARLIVLLLVTLTTSVRALTGTLEPQNPVMEVGSDFTLNCTLDPSSNDGRTAYDVIWQHNSTQLPQDSYLAMNDTVSQLSLSNATFNTSGTYYCFFPGDGFFDKRGSLVRVGIKPEAPFVECFIRNLQEFWCHWEERTSTNLRTEHKFTFMFGSSWRDCPQINEKGLDTCLVPITYILGTWQKVRVTSTNRLGESYTEKTFDQYNDVVVNPPSIRDFLKVDGETSLEVTWLKPDEWPNFANNLDFKLRYSRADCQFDSLNCWTEITEIGKSNGLIYTLRNQLDAYVTYVVQLAARYGLEDRNWSEWSLEKSQTTRETVPTATVRELKATMQSSGQYLLRNVHIFWTGLPEEQQNGRLLGYKVKIESDDNTDKRQKNVSTQNSNWCDFTGLQKYVGYKIRVAAWNSAGEGPWSEIRILDLTTMPNAPDEVRAVALTTTSIFVAWDAPSEPNGYIEHYIIEWGRSGGEKRSYQTANGHQQNHTIQNLMPFALYEVSVKVKNSRGEGGFTSVKGGIRTLEGVPDAPPTNVEIQTVENSPDRLVLMWERPPANNLHGNLTGYRISFCESSPTKAAYYDETGTACSGELLRRNVTRPDSVGESLINLNSATSYSVWIAAYTMVGTGPNSKPVQGTTAEEPQGILLQAIFIPTAVLLIVMALLLFLWIKFRHLFKPFPGPKFTKNVELMKNGSQTITRSSSRNEEEHFDEILLSPEEGICEGLLFGSCELAKEALQTSTSLELKIDCINLDPKTQTVKFIRSESRDSGVPPSPASESPDFGALRDRLSVTGEGDDDVFLENEDGKSDSKGRSNSHRPSEAASSPSSPNETIGSYTTVGQFRTSVSSPVKSQKRVSFEIPVANASDDRQKAPREQQKPGSNKRSLSCSSADVSPYTQMSAMESLQPRQQPNHQSRPLQSVCPANTGGSKAPRQEQKPGSKKRSLSCSSADVSPYTQMSAMESLRPRQQLNHQSRPLQSVSPANTGSLIQPLAVSPYTRMSVTESIHLHNRQNQARKLSSADVSSGTPRSSLVVSPNTKVSELPSPQPIKHKEPRQLSQQPSGDTRCPDQANHAPSSPPAVSPYILASSIEPPKCKQQGAHQPRQEPSGSPCRRISLTKPSPSSSTAVTPYTQPPPVTPTQWQHQNIQLPLIPTNKNSNTVQLGIPQQAVSPYTKMSEMEALQPRQNANQMLVRSVGASKQSRPPQANPQPAISPYTQLSEMEAIQPSHLSNPLPPEESQSLSPQPIPQLPVSPYTKMSEMEAMQPRKNTNKQLPAVSSCIQMPCIKTLQPVHQPNGSHPEIRQENHLLPQSNTQPTATAHPLSPQGISPYVSLSEVSKSPAISGEPIQVDGSIPEIVSHTPPQTSNIAPYTQIADMDSLNPNQTSWPPHNIPENAVDERQIWRHFTPDAQQTSHPETSRSTQHPSALDARSTLETGYCTFGNSDHQTLLPQESKSSSQNKQTTAKDPNDTSSGCVHAPHSSDDSNLNEEASAQGLPSLGSDSGTEDDIEDYSQMSTSVVISAQPRGSEPAQPISASNHEITDYTLIGRNDCLQSPEPAQPEHMPTTHVALHPSALECSPIAVIESHFQEAQSSDDELNDQGDPPTTSTDVSDYTLVASAGSQNGSAGSQIGSAGSQVGSTGSPVGSAEPPVGSAGPPVGSIGTNHPALGSTPGTSHVHYHSQSSSEDGGFYNETDSDDTSWSPLSDYVLTGAHGGGYDTNPQVLTIPTSSNHGLSTASVIQPVSDYVVAGTNDIQGTGVIG